jgi:hypothetical protein
MLNLVEVSVLNTNLDDPSSTTVTSVENDLRNSDEYDCELVKCYTGRMTKKERETIDINNEL